MTRRARGSRIGGTARNVGHPGGMPYAEKLLGDDEDVVAHLHPHWLTIL